ncbi:hypothetical protein Xen7305DRAFT_00052100 [Xenococcus sp. PCC 7305]|nr:hypothetical protein Xen7305DRAFT_00052100 [Xenococcus sp. PCC 7305]
MNFVLLLRQRQIGFVLNLSIFTSLTVEPVFYVNLFLDISRYLYLFIFNLRILIYVKQNY